MLELTFTAADLARTRLAVSPLWEVVASVRVLKEPEAHPLLRPWTERAVEALAAAKVDRELLDALVPVPTRWLPGFVCPPPAAPAQDLPAELAAVRATPGEEVRRALAMLPGPRPAVVEALAEHPERELGRLADAVAHYWEVALEPHWPRLRALLEGDVLHRSRTMAEGGLTRLLADLDPRVTWDGERTLRLAHRHVRGTRELGGRGLLLVPSAFVWPRIFSVTGPPEQPALRYAPHGIGTLWQERAAEPRAGLAGVLGATRVRLLAELAAPATTVTLAGRTGLSPAAVSQHLTLLRNAGLVSRHRSGRLVFYARTGRAEGLLAD